MSLSSYFVLVLVSVGVVLVSADYGNEISATVGQSVALNYDYKGPNNVRCYFLKDGKIFRADRRRVFQRLGRIYFSKVIEADAGVYRMIIRDRRVYYNKAITLTGKYNQFKTKHMDNYIKYPCIYICIYFNVQLPLLCSALCYSFLKLS